MVQEVTVELKGRQQPNSNIQSLHLKYIEVCVCVYLLYLLLNTKCCHIVQIHISWFSPN